MLKKSFPFFLFFLLSNVGFAQHCGYDFAGILVIDVLDKETNKSINGLQISLVNPKGETYQKQFYREGYWIDDDVYFYHHSIEAKNKSIYDFEYENIWFIQEAYALVISYDFDLLGFQILIEDVDGSENGVYKTKKIRLSKSLIFHLCTDASNWDAVDQRNKIEGLQVLTVRI